jgi:hypothetical protein
VRPLLRKAISCSRRATVSALYVVVSKIDGSAQKVTDVPVRSVAPPSISSPGSDRS